MHRRRGMQQAKTIRASAHERGYTYQWATYSARYRKQHPLCRQCGLMGRLSPTECVDHIIPSKPGDPGFWDSNNHQPLCNSCHSRKTASEDGGFNHRGKIRPDIGLDGWPVAERKLEAKAGGDV